LKNIFLIDIPQSPKAPHRVNELHYYQRHNFMTLPMEHHQISDAFGKRMAPDLTISITQDISPSPNHFRIKPLIQNQGRAVAKYVACICSIISGNYLMTSSEKNQWHIRKDSKSSQFTTGISFVIYPEVPHDVGFIDFAPNGAPQNDPLILAFDLCAEGMPKKQITLELLPILTPKTNP
jgi:hypothetical protein